MSDGRRNRKRVPGSKRSSPEAYRAYMRVYMQARRDAEHEEGRHARTALYDPLRDGYPQYASPQAELFGDPPIGRSALERRP